MGRGPALSCTLEVAQHLSTAADPRATWPPPADPRAYGSTARGEDLGVAATPCWVCIGHPRLWRNWLVVEEALVIGRPHTHAPAPGTAPPTARAHRPAPPAPGAPSTPGAPGAPRLQLVAPAHPGSPSSPAAGAGHLHLTRLRAMCSMVVCGAGPGGMTRGRPRAIRGIDTAHNTGIPSFSGQDPPRTARVTHSAQAVYAHKPAALFKLPTKIPGVRSFRHNVLFGSPGKSPPKRSRRAIPPEERTRAREREGQEISPEEQVLVMQIDATLAKQKVRCSRVLPRAATSAQRPPPTRTRHPNARTQAPHPGSPCEIARQKSRPHVLEATCPPVLHAPFSAAA